MCEVRRAVRFLLCSSILVSTALSGCNGTTSGSSTPPVSTEDPGTCVPFEPYKNYHTCVMTKPPLVVSKLEQGLKTYSNLPSSVDHRSYLNGCIQVHDQGPCGWCAVHATTANLESMLCRDKKPCARISEPHLRWLYEPLLNNGQQVPLPCREGSFPDRLLQAAEQHALVPNEVWPYCQYNLLEIILDETGVTNNCLDHINQKKPTETTLASLGRYRAVTRNTVPWQDVDALKAALAAGNNVVYSVPVLLGVGWGTALPVPYTYGSIKAPAGKTGWDDLCDCEKCPLDLNCVKGWHAILIVGYDDADGGSFSFLNSWGTGWADGGYGRIDYATIRNWGQGGVYPSAVAIDGTSTPPNPSPTCDALSCPAGCCNGNVCEAGTSAQKCGGGGAACVSCASGGACADGKCSSCTPMCAGKCAGASDECGGTCPSSQCGGCCLGSTCVGSVTDKTCGSNGSPCADCTVFGGGCSGGGCTGCSKQCAGKCAGAPDGCGGACPSNQCAGCCSGTACITAVGPTSCGSSGSPCTNCTTFGGTCANGSCTSCTRQCAGKCAGEADGCGGTCSTNQCSGCCDSYHRCQAGASDSACGGGGGSCSVCSGTTMCSGGTCVTAPPASYKVTLVQAKWEADAAGGCWFGCDSYIKLSIGGKPVGQSQMVGDSTNPVWNQVIATSTDAALMSGISGELWDANNYGTGDKLHCTFSAWPSKGQLGPGYLVSCTESGTKKATIELSFQKI